ncbi:hypothetical protein [Bradyrhizobium canariense]|uniref:hypothetical protein n=1 Tax=Bradyrhizobium canariense TaxID=255045 RepID=UPI001B8A2923|nr:hypothetical protein [Bradyrhizobium canariense]MBR0950439.1 hypothetical protein [Bradyrhizobium canariense]
MQYNSFCNHHNYYYQSDSSASSHLNKAPSRDGPSSRGSDNADEVSFWPILLKKSKITPMRKSRKSLPPSDFFREYILQAKKKFAE